MKRFWLVLTFIITVGAVAFVLCIPVVAPTRTRDQFSFFPTPTPGSMQKPMVFVFGGDVMLGRRVNYKLKQAMGYAAPFRDIKNQWEDADAVMINLESPLYELCPVVDNLTMQFCTEPVLAEVLAEAGITHVSFANNHMLDYGKLGIDDTNRLLGEAGIMVVNHGVLTVSEIAGKKIGFLSWNLTWNNVTENEIKNALGKAGETVDLLIVNFHWGEEYIDEPGEYQKRIAHFSIDNGADIIIGHHQHHVQPIESYNGKLIFYSLGNLIFDQLWSEKTRQGKLVKIQWDPDTDQFAYAVTHTYMESWIEAIVVK